MERWKDEVLPADASATAEIGSPESLSGRVVDDTTGEPIVDFVVQYLPPNSGKPEEAYWNPIFVGSQQKPGVFDGVQSPSPQSKLRIIAPGYLPQLLAEQSVENPPASGLEVRLKRGDEFHGVVLDDAGRPVPGARVFLTTLWSLYLMEGQRFTAISFYGGSTITDSAGRFSCGGWVALCKGSWWFRPMAL